MNLKSNFNSSNTPIDLSKYNVLFDLFKTLVPNSTNTDTILNSFTDLVQRYSEPHRHYHIMDHLADLAAQFIQHESLFEADRDSVLAALFYHDVVYECRHGQDEKESAEYARMVLTELGIKSETIEKACSIILATATHKADDFLTQLFLDIDMSILASPPEKYDAYARATREEYCGKLGISHDVFNGGRSSLFLSPTLNNGSPIFATEQYILLEETARENMKRELASYQHSTDHSPTAKPE